MSEETNNENMLLNMHQEEACCRNQPVLFGNKSQRGGSKGVSEISKLYI